MWVFIWKGSVEPCRRVLLVFFVFVHSVSQLDVRSVFLVVAETPHTKGGCGVVSAVFSLSEHRLLAFCLCFSNVSSWVVFQTL